MVTNALQSLIAELEADASLHEPKKLRRRLEALDRLDVFNLDLDSTGAPAFHRARALQAKLEAANRKIYDAIRREIQQGRGPTQLYFSCPLACSTSRADWDTTIWMI